MAPSLNATIGGASANSYQAVADATAYFANTLFSAQWGALTSDVKAQALITATQWLETLTYTGTRATTTQRLEWPRDATNSKGLAANNATIPAEILAAQAELALALGTTPTALTGDLGTTNTNGATKRQKLDALEVEYFAPWAPDTGALLQRFRWLRPLIATWLLNNSPQLAPRVRS